MPALGPNSKLGMNQNRDKMLLFIVTQPFVYIKQVIFYQVYF
jgi:hypothetical protein